MASDRDLEKADALTATTKTISSSSDSSSGSTDETTPSPPSTPSDDDEENQLPRIQHSPHSSNLPRRGNRRTRGAPAARLGAIDEHSNTIAPDIPTRNPNRRLAGLKYGYAAKLFGFGGAWANDSDVPPPGAYDKIIGPRGEKFSDLRKNKPYTPPGRGGWKKIICLGLVVLLILAIALAVGLGVGLTRKKGTSTKQQPATTDLPTSDNEEFPLGTWSIPTYLVSQNTSCTSNPATFRCYPYTTYSASSADSSFSTLLWSITSPTNSTLDLTISNTNPTFSYPFSNVPMQLNNTNDPRLSAFTFSFTYRKQVAPNADITGDGSATRCYFNNTRVSVSLYNTAQGAGGKVRNSTIVGGGARMSWPYAIEYEETIGTAPECFRYANGVETTAVSVAAGSGTCECAYRNYGLA